MRRPSSTSSAAHLIWLGIEQILTFKRFFGKEERERQNLAGLLVDDQS